MDLLRLIAKFIFVLYLLKNRIAMEKMRQNLQETILSGDRGCKTGACGAGDRNSAAYPGNRLYFILARILPFCNG